MIDFSALPILQQNTKMGFKPSPLDIEFLNGSKAEKLEDAKNVSGKTFPQASLIPKQILKLFQNIGMSCGIACSCHKAVNWQRGSGNYFCHHFLSFYFSPCVFPYFSLSSMFILE